MDLRTSPDSRSSAESNASNQVLRCAPVGASAVRAVGGAQNSKHTTMAVPAVADVEFREVVADVCLDGAFADHESVGDGGVGDPGP